MAAAPPVLQATGMSEFRAHLLRVSAGSAELSEPLSLKGWLSEQEFEATTFRSP